MGNLNGRESLLYDMEIVGNEVLLDGSSLEYARINNRQDVASLTIIAETVRITDEVSLPQTSVTIYARRLIFSGLGRISTSPASLEGLPEPKEDGSAADGMPGLSGGSIALNVGGVETSAPTKVIVLTGAKGQAAGQGRPPIAGASLPSLPTEELLPQFPGRWRVITNNPNYGNCTPVPEIPDANYPNAIICWQCGQLGGPTASLGTDRQPGDGDGIPGKKGGTPGKGGAGGHLASNVPLDAASYDQRGGEAGQPYIDDTTPGAAGLPNPSYTVQCYFGPGSKMLIRHDTKPGLPAVSPTAEGLAGVDGDLVIVGGLLEWLRPHNAEVTLQYADDLFVSRRLTQAKVIYGEYVDLLDAASQSRTGVEQSELLRLLGWARRRHAQILLGMDSYGNPAGWVPILSLEIAQGVYESELHRSANYFYLSFWLGKKLDDAEAMARTLQALYDHLGAEVRRDQSELNSMLATEIPKYIADIANLRNEQKLLASKFRLREQQLKQIAENDASRAAEARATAGALRICGVLVSLIPVQPAGAIIGAVIIGMADHDDLWTIVEHAFEAYLLSSAYEKAFSSLVKNVNGLDWSSSNALWTSVDAIPSGETLSRGVLIAGDAGKVYARGSELMQAKAQSSFTAEMADDFLKKYSDLDPEYTQLVKDAKALLQKTQEAFTRLQDVQNKASATALSLAKNTQSLKDIAVSMQQAALQDRTAVAAEIWRTRKRAESLLQYYSYILARAYEYRLVEAFPHSITPQLDVQILQDAANQNQEMLTEPQAGALMAPYTQILTAVARGIYDIYVSSRRPIEQVMDRAFSFESDELKQMSAGKPIFINIANRNEFRGLSTQNSRISRITLQTVKVVGSRPNSIDLIVRHGGASVITLDHRNYFFSHIGLDGDARFTWRTTWDFHLDIPHVATPSPGALSLFASLLLRNSSDLTIFSSPGLDATLVVSIDQGTLLEISEMSMLVTYTFEQI